MSEIIITYGNFKFDSKEGYPCPKVSFDISKSRTSAGDFLMLDKTVTLEGICYVKRKTDHNDGLEYGATSPKVDYSVSGLFEAADSLKTQILENNYKSLTVRAIGSQPLISGNYAIVDSIVFSENENNWADSINYTIVFNIPTSGSGSHLISRTEGSFVTSVTDNYTLESLYDNQFWDIAFNIPIPTYKVSHTIGAVGKNIGSPSGSLHWAKKWVRDRDNYFGLINMFPLSHFTLYNQERSVDVSESNGSYQIIDTFIAKSGNDPWIDTFKATVSLDKQYKISIDIDGSVQGLEPASGVYAEFVDYRTTPPIRPSGQYSIKNPVSGYNPQGYDSNNGLKINNSNIATTKYRNAVSGWKIIEPLLIGRASGYLTQAINMIPLRFRNSISSIPLNNIPISTSEQLFPFVKAFKLFLNFIYIYVIVFSDKWINSSHLNSLS